MSEEAVMLEPKEELIATDDPTDAAINMNKKKRLCRHPVCERCVIHVQIMGVTFCGWIKVASSYGSISLITFFCPFFLISLLSTGLYQSHQVSRSLPTTWRQG